MSIDTLRPDMLGCYGYERPTSPTLDGLDLAPLWAGAAPAALRNRVFFGEADHENSRPDATRSARRGVFKLLYDRRTQQATLYDLAADPGETLDASGEHPEEARELRAELDAFQRDVRADAPPLPLPELPEDDVERLRALGYL